MNTCAQEMPGKKQADRDATDLSAGGPFQNHLLPARLLSLGRGPAFPRTTPAGILLSRIQLWRKGFRKGKKVVMVSHLPHACG